MSLDLTELLPTELLGACLEFAETQTVLCASHVCARWRATARGCRVFWRWISIESSSNNALDFFHARLNSNNAPGISVTIMLHIEAKNQAAATIFQLGLASATLRLELERHLTRIGVLYISAPQPAMMAITPALASRADILTALTLRIPWSPSERSPTIPVAAPIWDKSWAIKHSPLLSMVHMENIALLTDERQPWFATVTNISLCFTDCVAALPADIFHQFPVGKSIRFQLLPSARVQFTSATATASPKVQPYTSVSLLTGDFAQLLPLVPHLSSTPTIRIGSMGRNIDMDALLDQMEDPLDLSMYLSPSLHMLRLYVTTQKKDHSRGRQPKRVRELTLPGSVALDPASTVLADLTAGIMPRISGVRVSLRSVHLIAKITFSEKVHGLMVHVDQPTTPADWAADLLPIGQARQSLPSLNTILIHASNAGIPRPAEALVQKLLHRLIGDDSKDLLGDWTRPVITVSGFMQPVSDTC